MGGWVGGEEGHRQQQQYQHRHCVLGWRCRLWLILSLSCGVFGVVPCRHIESSHAFRVTEAEPSIRTFLEKRLDYRHKGTIYIQVRAGTRDRGTGK